MSQDDEREDDRSVTSKIISILEAFRPSTTEMSLNDLARRIGLAVSTAYRHANKMVELGVLERGEGGGYRIGLRLWEIASLARRGLSLRELAAPYLLDLYEVTHENVHLAILDDFEALYIAKTTGHRSVELKSKEARRLPLHATGSGKVLLAHSSKEFIAAVIARGLPAFTPHTITSPAVLLRALADIRTEGYSTSVEGLTLGTVSVAAPVRDAAGKVVAALSVVGRTVRMDPTRVALAVKTAAVGISRDVAGNARAAERTLARSLTRSPRPE